MIFRDIQYYMTRFLWRAISALRCSIFQYRASCEFGYLIDNDLMMQFEPPTSLLLGGLLLKIVFNDCQPYEKTASYTLWPLIFNGFFSIPTTPFARLNAGQCNSVPCFLPAVPRQYLRVPPHFLFIPSFDIRDLLDSDDIRCHRAHLYV